LFLTRANAQRLTETLSDLRGAAMKLGQLLSMHGDDFLPPSFVEVLSSLRDQAFVMPESQVRQVLQRELGEDWETLFAEFDFEPLAAASIGQVHAAQAADGRDLALKIQYPGVSRSISSDVDNLAVFLRVSKLLPGEIDYESLVPEIKRELSREADYRREADNTERYRMLVESEAGVIVPQVHRDLCTEHVLALERIYALPIEDLRSPEHSPELRNRIGTQMIALTLRELFRFRFMQTDPNFANYLFEPKHQRLALLDFGSTRHFSKIFTEDYRSLIIAAVERNEGALFEIAIRLGFLRAGDAPDLRLAFIEICELFAEPLRHEGPYDFAASDLAQRVRDRGFEAMTDLHFVQPPAETLFLHRKLAGSFLLCAHIGASVDCHRLYQRAVKAR
jgi:predicted unusual protein kinase regulating ubiquinone biosynthesis (AarF/ABC1/UbiB family)